jgi:hypothetical protein
MQALPARRSASLTPGSRRVGLDVKRRVVYLSARSFAAIQFSRPQAPRLSAEPLGELITQSRRQNAHLSVGLGKHFRVCEEATLCAPSWLSKSPPTSALGLYHPAAPCQPSSAGTHAVFAPTQGSQITIRSAGCRSAMVQPGSRSASAIVAPLQKRSSKFGKNFRVGRNLP